VAVTRAGVGGDNAPAMFVVVDPRAGVPQPRSEWRTSERALQRAKEPRHTGTPLDEHSQVFVHDLRQDLLV